MARYAVPAVLVALSLSVAASARADVVFDSSGVYPVSSSMGAVVATDDFNGDERLDLVSVARYDPAAPVSVLLGNGDGTFQKTTGIAAGGLALATGDLNSDGDADVALPASASTATILFGNGDGTFDAPVGVGTPNGGALGGVSSIAIAQLGGSDPGMDIAVTNAAGLQVLFGKGDGTFADPATHPGWEASELVTADFTEDGLVDVALTRIIGGDTDWIAVLPGSASGALGAAIKTTIEEPLWSPVVMDDDGDGLLDVVGADSSMQSSTVTLYYGVGDGTFEEPQTADVGGASRVDVGDVDKDAKPDIITSTFDGWLVAWLGTGDFAESEYLAFPDGALSIVVADFNGDSADDVASATWMGNVVVSLNAPSVQAAPAALSFGSQTVGSSAPAQSVTVTNTGISDLRIGGVALEGPAAGDFAAGGSCPGATLKMRETCTITGAFTARAVGTRTANLVISGNQAGRSTRVPLTGTGVAVQSAIASDSTPPTLALKVRRLRLAQILRRGLRFSVTCSEACSVKATGRIDARVARRLGLSRSRKPFVVARAKGTVSAGRSKTLRLRLGRRAARVLRAEPAIVLTVVATARDAAGNRASAQQKLRLRG